jgi:8-oxo-dGTP pyrophosphatase MutT (NUDIX family)
MLSERSMWGEQEQSERFVDAGIREFGIADKEAAYVLRPGGYVVIFRDAGEVAAIDTPHGWVLPGGGLNDGESPEDAAIRETEEECGLQVILQGRIGIADELVFAAEERTFYRKRCTFFVAKVVGKVGMGEADHELAWLSLSGAVAKLRFASQQWAVSEAYSRGCQDV